MDVFIENYIKDVYPNENRMVDIMKMMCIERLTILDVVEEMGPFLSHSNSEIRGKCTRLLGEILHRMRKDELTKSQVSVIMEFLYDRLADHHSITKHVLYSFLALGQNEQFTDEYACRMMRSIFREVHVQSLAQGDRRHVYNLILNFLQNRLEAMKQMNGDFIYGYLQAMDAEKDPRCLLVAFKCVKIIASKFNIDTCVEELFEVVACYFPIDFTPPPSDPQGITKDELILGLRRCLSATPKFAEHCLPLLMEKMTSAVPSAKLDALLTLEACAEVYGAQALQEYLGSIWNVIKAEIFAPEKDEIMAASMGVLKAVTKTLSDDFDQTGKSSSLMSFVEDIMNDCKKHLNEPELRLLPSTAKLLQAVASASEPACVCIMSEVIPFLIEQFHKYPQTQTRQVIIGVMVSFLKVSTITGKSDSKIVTELKDNVLPLLQSLLTNSDAGLRCLAIQGITELVCSPGMVGDQVKENVVVSLTQYLATDPDETVRSECVKALARLAINCTDILQKITLPKLLQRVSNEECMETEEDSEKDIDREDVFDIIASVSVCYPLIKESVPHLISHIRKIGTEGPHTAEKLKECLSTCQCLVKIVEENSSSEDSLKFFVDIVSPTILRLALAGALSDEQNHICSDSDIIDEFATILRVITQSADEEQQAKVLLPMAVGLFMEGKIPQADDDVDVPETSFQLLLPMSPLSQTQLVTLLLAMVGSARIEVEVPQANKLLQKLFVLALKSPKEASSYPAAKCYSAIINKLGTGDDVEILLQPVRGILTAEMENEQNDMARRVKCLTLWAWLAKALILQGNRRQSDFLEKMVELIGDTTLDQQAALCFFTLLNDYDDVMSAAMHADIKLMHKQRIFLLTSKGIIEGFNKATEEKKFLYLTALSFLVKFVPRQVVMFDLEAILPLLVHSIKLDEDTLLLASLNTFYNLMFEAPDRVAKFVDDIIPNLVRLSKKKSILQVRTFSLQCLQSAASLPKHAIYPYQKKVLKSLVGSVDDHKRLVRVEAVKARTKWITLGDAKS